LFIVKVSTYQQNVRDVWCEYKSIVREGQVKNYSVSSFFFNIEEDKIK
jgi:L-rhamnose mutarotase